MVEILRDGLGVPHCYADDEDEAFFAQGWVHAADRLWQLEYDRRRAMGRWAEVVGRRGVASDVFHRRMDLVAAVRRDLAGLATTTVAMLEAYAAGVNAWMAANPLTREFAVARLESGPEPWEPWHSLLVFRVRHLLMGSARTKLWRSVVAEVLGADVARTMVAGFGDDDVACVPPGEVCDSGGRVAPGNTGLGGLDGGSNNWVLAGARTASGLPLLAGDPHRELEAPNVYVQGHVACPSWDVLGLTMPGVPGFTHFGHNQHVAWSITHAMADDQDLFEVHDGGGGSGGVGVVATRTEVVDVRDGEPVEVDVTMTDRGPVVGVGLALSWTATIAPNHGFDAILPLLRSRSVGDVFEAMRGWVEPVNNLLAADTAGTIGYLTRGRLPKRRSADGAWLPVPGDDPSHAWDGWVAFEDLPRCVDPDVGFLFSANNRIAASADAPYVGVDASSPWRARRIVDALRSMRGATVDDMAALQRDVVSLPGRRMVERLAGSWAPLAGWDGGMDVDATAAAAYSVLRRELLLLALERSGLAGALDHPRNRLLPGVVPESACWRAVEQHLHTGDTSLLGGWTWDDGLAEAVARAEKAWSGGPWGDLHRTAQRHALGDPSLDPRRVPVAGDPDTVCATGYTPTAGFDVKTGPVARYVFDVADWDRSMWAVPLGAAGEPGTTHADDQLDGWRDGRLFPAPYTRAAVEAAAVARATVVVPAAVRRP
jgi:penicillin amidase